MALSDRSYTPAAPRAINPWQTAAMEQKQSATHAGLTDAYAESLGRAPEQAGLDYWSKQVNNDQLSLGSAQRSIANSAEGKTRREDIEAAVSGMNSGLFRDYMSDRDLYKGASQGDFGSFSDEDKSWYGQVAKDSGDWIDGSTMLGDLGNTSLGNKPGANETSQERNRNLLEAAYKAQQAQAGEASDEVSGVTTAGGIRYDPAGPVGGTMVPQQTYTPHTGSQEVRGEKGKREGTGGGEPEEMRTPSRAEQIHARPDLRQSAPIVQAQVAAPQGPVNSIQNQMAQAKALRAGGQ